MLDFNNHEIYLKLLNNFNSDENLEQAISHLLTDLCEGYHFDKVTSYFDEKIRQEFIWFHIHKLNHDGTKYIDIYNEDNAINIKEYTMSMIKKDFEREEEINNVFLDRSYIWSRDINSILQSLERINFKYIAENVEKIKELFIYPIIDKNSVIGYFSFERYKEEYLSVDDIENIKTILGVISKNIALNERIKEKDKGYRVKKALSELSQQDSYVAVVEKETFNLLYYENTDGGVIQNDEINRKCYEVSFGLNEPCVHCPVLYNELNESVYSKRNDGDYITRATEINWLNESDAYIVAAMNATKAFERKLSNDSLTDSLTWFGFKEKIKETSDSKAKYVYISLNVEGMKLLNDIHTQVVGDEILKQISLTLKKFVQDDEYYCRVVADTYAIVLKFVDDKDLNERVKNLDKALSIMFRNVFSEIIIIITGGICIVENNLYENIDKGFGDSGLARNLAKGSYKNTFVFYDETMREQLKANKYIESKIETAIVNDEFSAYLQPKFELATNKIVGAEALVRWHSSNETIFPDNFIPVFESDGFISTLDFIIYEKIFIFIRDCLAENVEVVPISINASRNHLQDDDFFGKLLMLFKTYNVPKELIEIEITENASEGSDEDLKEFVKKLKDENIAVSMDDFGSAYSSLNLLKTLEIDTLKLDKAFLGKVEKEKFTDLYSKDEIIIKNIVNMANELGFKVLCEGVETKEQAEFLRSIGCNYGQGYILSKPLPLEEFKNRFLCG